MSLNPKTGTMTKTLRQIVAEWIAPKPERQPSFSEILVRERAETYAALLDAEDQQERAQYTVKMLEARVSRLTKRIDAAEGRNE